MDLSGKVAVVTGGYSGIGLETTRVLAGAGATVIVPARNPDKARKALNPIPRVEQSRLDLGGVYCADVDIAEVLQSDAATGPGVLPGAIDPKTAAFVDLE
jgi:NAD(P)-dependent dehydrogenase (short-subunit alcohol dehydrogenase family)